MLIIKMKQQKQGVPSWFSQLRVDTILNKRRLPRVFHVKGSQAIPSDSGRNRDGWEDKR